jgi:hypothetical protein
VARSESIHISGEYARLDRSGKSFVVYEFKSDVRERKTIGGIVQILQRAKMVKSDQEGSDGFGTSFATRNVCTFACANRQGEKILLRFVDGVTVFVKGSSTYECADPKYYDELMDYIIRRERLRPSPAG